MHLKMLCAAAAAVALAACGANNGAPVAPPTPQTALLTGDTALDLTYNQIGKALVANWAGLTSPQRASAKALSAKLYAAASAADAAETLGDAATVADRTTAAGDLVRQIDGLLPASAQVAPPSTTTGG